MPLSNPTHLITHTYSGAADASETTPSISPSANALLYVGVAVFISNADPGTISSITTTLSGVGSWTVHSPVASSNSRMRLAIATAQCGASPGTGTITVNLSGLGATRWIVFVGEVTGHDTTTPITQSKNNSAASGTSITVTLDSTPASTSLVLGMVLDNYATNTNIASGTDFSELVEQEITNIQAQMQYNLNDADTTCDWSSLNGAGTASGGLLAIAIEIAEASGGTNFDQSVSSSISPSSTTIKNTNKLFTSGIDSTATLIKNVATNIISNITSNSTISTTTDKILSSDVNLSSGIIKDVFINLSSSIGITTTLDLIKIILVILSSVLSMNSSLNNLTTKQISAIINMSSILLKNIQISFTGFITASSLLSVAHIINAVISSSVDISSNLIKDTTKNLNSVVVISGASTRYIFKILISAIGIISSLINNSSVVSIKGNVDIGDKQTNYLKITDSAITKLDITESV